MIVKESLKPKVNDGSGLYDNAGLIDTLITDCNNLVKALASGQYILFCKTVLAMVQKLGNLKEGYLSEIESRDAQVDALMKRMDEMAEDMANGTN